MHKRVSHDSSALPSCMIVHILAANSTPKTPGKAINGKTVQYRENTRNTYVRIIVGLERDRSIRFPLRAVHSHPAQVPCELGSDTTT